VVFLPGSRKLNGWAIASVRAALFTRQAAGPALPIADESRISDRGGTPPRHCLHACEPGCEDAGSVKQLLVERANRRHPLAGKLASLHADEVEAFKRRMLAVDQAERDNVATHTTNAANHHLRADPGELMHRGETANVDEVADLTMTAKRCGGREDYVVADHTIVPDMGIVHEESAFAAPGHATAFHVPHFHVP